MTREEAYEFIQLYKKFIDSVSFNFRIFDFNESSVEFEYEDPDGLSHREWYDDWTAAEIIEENSQRENYGKNSFGPQ